MSESARDVRTAVWAGTLASSAMIAHQMAGKATRDALFLSTYGYESLPAMVIGAALVSLALAWIASRVGGRYDPGRLVPVVFALSAVLTLLEWWLLPVARGAVAIMVYLHLTGLGALLVSGFWSTVSERFDPRSAKSYITRIAAGGTVGGVLGGVLAERGAAMFSIEAMFPLLAFLHFSCAILTRRFGRVEASPALTAEFARQSGGELGLQVLRRSPYLTAIGALIFLTALSEGLLDLGFKSWASLTITDGDALLRFFAVFYTAVALITMLFQTLATRGLLQRFGLAASAGTLPAVVAVGAIGIIAFPGLLSSMVARGAESITRNSVYRSAYELLFNPVTAPDRRVVKPLLDVGVVRMGDLTAGALAQLVILLTPGGPRGAVYMLVTFVMAVAAIAVARRLHQGYLKTLEKSLLVRGSYLQGDGMGDAAQTAVLQTLGAIDLTQFRQRLTTSEGTESEGPAAPAPPSANIQATVPPEFARVAELRSRDQTRVQRALKDGPMTLDVVPHVVPLLAWDDVAKAAIHALRPVANKTTGLLTDCLLDPDTDFSVRRRLPLVLVSATTQRSVDGLVAALQDRRFEVRYRCGRVLSKLHSDHPSLHIDRDTILSAIDREVAVDRGVWESRRLLDATEEEESPPVIDEVLRERADRSMEHVFTMLSLILPAQPLRVAFRGLYTDDALLRGTALEYLESALPEDLRRKLWPFLENPIRAADLGRSSGNIGAMDELFKSNESIVERLDALKRYREKGD